jgi:uncharacterized secreted protein with C-terminal beta-propeller domain
MSRVGSVRLLSLTLLAAFPLTLTGCPSLFPGGSGGEENSTLVPFKSRSEVLSYFKRQATRRNSGMGGVFFRGEDLALPAAAPSADSGAEAGGGDDSSDGATVSTTNVQEEGVDEGDILKTDGTYFYIARGRSLRIVRASPPEQLEELSELRLETRISEMYLRDGRLIVLGTDYGYAGGVPTIAAEIYPPYAVAATTTISEIDVSDAENPGVSREITLDGSLVTSRLTNDRLIAVLTIAPPLPPDPTPLSISIMDLPAILPMARTTGGDSELLAPENWYHPVTGDGYFTTAVVTLDADNIETTVASVGIMADAGTIYASTEALYVSDDEYDFANNFRETTAIHKFDFDSDGAARYVATGRVPGRLLNQFALGEYEGALRVATFVSNFGAFGGVGVGVAEPAVISTDTAQDQTDAEPPPAPSNSVYVLRESGDALEIVGAVEGIAPNERLFAARFMGPRGFLVTFEQIDPLFTLELSDADNPQLVGELVVPGYSDYLHPLGDSHLIGVGRSVAETGFGGVVPHALQLSLFDVSDLANPTLVERLEIGGYGSASDVSYTHKAFTLLPNEGLLAIPAQLFPEDNGLFEHKAPAFDGVLIFNVDDGGFTEVTRIASVLPSLYPYVAWRRAAFIDDTAYAVTPAGVRSVLLSDTSVTSDVELDVDPNTPSGGDDGSTGVGEGDGSSGSPGRG